MQETQQVSVEVLQPLQLSFTERTRAHSLPLSHFRQMLLCGVVTQ